MYTYVDTVDTTTTSSLQPTTTTTSIPVSTITTPIPTDNVTVVTTTEIPVAERPEFIVAMIIVGLFIIVMLCVLMLCCVRPKQGPDGQRRRRKQPLTLPTYSGVLTPSSTTTYDYSTFPSEHGWVPNQPPVVSDC